ncbi:unnamed protein product [Psylliodes chrysocephalus]|uniref:receptor protein-tyrosine kinase n=1 Tax=Psylliodes chrysocephalus TaxID=3402493 RepID=A0A9P0D6S7_9CUCU|nr:unnamed protein product [Psylliodes chrysocephala]
MAYKVLLLLVLCKWINFSLGSDFYSRPHILLNGTEDIIEAYDNYTVFCQGNKPLQWTTPTVNAELAEQFYTTFTSEDEKPSNTNFKYGLRLYITNMTYPFVGFYSCHFKNTQDISEKNDKNDIIYLFVNDNENLALLTDEDRTILHIYVVQHQTATIPCRPTSPTVDVKLETFDFKNDIDYVYDNKVGFSFSILDPTQCGFYMCTFTRDNATLDLLVNVELRDSSTSYIPAPRVIDENEGHTNLGDNITLKCNLQFTTSVVIFSWVTPTGIFNPSRMKQTDEEKSSELTVYNTTFNDSGVYICEVSDHQQHHVSRNISIKIYDEEEHIITMRELTDQYYYEAKAGQDSIIWSVDIWGHPKPSFYWIDNRNDSIPEEKGKKYEVSRGKSDIGQNHEVITLKIKNIDLIRDFGYYSLVGTNHFMEKRLEFFLNVTDKPTVTLRSDQFHLVGTPGKVECIAAAHPTPVFEWRYKECLNPECPFILIPSNISNTEGLTVSSEVIINAKTIGIVECKAANSVGFESEEMEYIVTDVPNGFAMTEFDDTVVINKKTETAQYAVGEKIHVSCGASRYKYGHVEWLVNGTSIEEDTRTRVTYTKSELSNNVILDIDDASYNDSGLYSCRVSINASDYIFKNMSFLITDPVRAQIIDSNMVGEMLEDFPKSVSFSCVVKGIPKPKIFWYKNDEDLKPKKDQRISFENDNQLLKFNETKPSDQGTYKCLAIYKEFSDFREVKLKFKNAPAMIQSWMVYIIVILLLALVAIMVYLFIRVRKDRLLKEEMKLLGLANFEKGAVENINPELGIDDQAELLPYDRKWEFPIEQLKLGKQLGSGAFGVVLKGEAKHIVEGEPLTTVAVKMVKKNADNTYIKALASELKIMAHLGKHLNVVNLLGACTKNVAKRELLVIVEYCRFGNLQNFLLRHRQHFINQIDPNTEKVNYLIGQEELMDRTYSVSSNRSNIQSPLLKYAALIFSDSGENSVLPPPNAMGDYRTNANTGITEVTTVTQGEEGVVTSNNSIQPEWRSNYKGDYKDNVNPISTKDLIAWSFQIARGMEYLASRKVLHGDLAARNVLLSDENIVKICDFGLAKNMYKSDNYKKRGDCPLPVKWMAIESIRDRVFSTQSDVWSFGIVLWEIFSLGRTPYPGMEADERLYHKLVDGYRLESPEYSPKEIYQIMTDCWSVKPTFRPSFTKLTEKIGTLLEDTLRKHYIDLNDPYLAMNTKMLDKNDYLAMLSPPTFEAVLSPHYVNGMVTPQSSEGYMSMNSSTIFSPRIANDEVFDFTTASRRKLSSEDGNGHELLPMLKDKNDLDISSPLASPNAVSNPGYHLPPIIGTDEDNNTEIVKSADNYVNMPQNKNLLKECKTILSSDSKKAEDENRLDWKSIQV